MVATGIRCCAYPNLRGEGGWVASGDTKPTTGAHEVAHMYGRLHPLGCPPQGNLFEEIINGEIYADPDYPNTHFPDTISPTDIGTSAIYGFDGQNLTADPIIDPSKDYDLARPYVQRPVDLMSYCPYRKEWISDYTYHGLMNYFQNPPPLSQTQQAEIETDRLAIYGFADLNANQVEM